MTSDRYEEVRRIVQDIGAGKLGDRVVYDEDARIKNDVAIETIKECGADIKEYLQTEKYEPTEAVDVCDVEDVGWSVLISKAAVNTATINLRDGWKISEPLCLASKNKIEQIAKEVSNAAEMVVPMGATVADHLIPAVSACSRAETALSIVKYGAYMPREAVAAESRWGDNAITLLKDAKKTLDYVIGKLEGMDMNSELDSDVVRKWIKESKTAKEKKEPAPWER